MLEVQIFTLYPDLFPGLLDVGIYKKAKEKQKWSLKIIDIRDYALMITGQLMTRLLVVEAVCY